MGDSRDVVCSFCGSMMRLSRKMPGSGDTHALCFFTCATCGASELRIDRNGTTDDSAEPAHDDLSQP
ncbi:MAG: hypothetical protein JO328_11500 [Hyphomicrobiales bacterium]|nr:hypothetical protein [Hyphomicrobiales bacterium]MBV8824610.1 hypothetical protein [Hyphomicrobiales bacterium]